MDEKLEIKMGDVLKWFKVNEVPPAVILSRFLGGGGGRFGRCSICFGAALVFGGSVHVHCARRHIRMVPDMNSLT